MTTNPPAVSRTFRILTVVTALLVGVAVLPALIAVVAVWLPGDFPRELYSEDIAAHRVHAIAISAGNWILFGSILTQLRRPQHKTATMILAVATLVIVIPFDLMFRFFTPLEVVALALLVAMYWLHPTRRTSNWHPMNRVAAAVAAIGAVPWLIYAWGQLQTQLNGSTADRHVELGHYGFTAAVTLIILAAAAIGTTALPGWRAATILAAAGTTIFGVTSIVLPDGASSLGVDGGTIAIIWAAALVTIAWIRTKSGIPQSGGFHDEALPTHQR